MLLQTSFGRTLNPGQLQLDSWDLTANGSYGECNFITGFVWIQNQWSLYLNMVAMPMWIVACRGDMSIDVLLLIMWQCGNFSELQNRRGI